MDFQPVHFFEEPIEAHFDRKPALQKKPGCPESFTWRGETFRVESVVSEWHDYKRRGRMSRNMIPTHAATAEQRGSWGVGKDYYRVSTEGNRYFDIYFDRAPRGADHRSGGWYIYREVVLHKPDEC